MPTPRYGNAENEDTTYRTLSLYYEEPAYASPLALTPKGKYKNTYAVAQLTGAITINVTDTNAKVGDELLFLFSADSTDRIVTFGTSLKSSGALTITADKFGSATFVHNGTDFIQTSSIQTV